MKLKLPNECRILVMSDIHTCYWLVEKVLKRANYDPQKDYLIICGDILERNGGNIETLRYIMKLCESEKAFLILGNNDTMVHRMAYVDSIEKII